MKIYFKERDIWWCSIGSNIGYEIDGKGSDFGRPVVVVKKYNQFGFLGIPLSTTSKKGRYYFSVGAVQGKEATAVLSQARFVSNKRLVNKMGVIDKATFGDLKQHTKDQAL